MPSALGQCFTERSPMALSALLLLTGYWAFSEQAVVSGVVAQRLNQHFALISTDQHYCPPLSKQTVCTSHQLSVSQWRVFRILDSLLQLHGLDQLPAWFLRLYCRCTSLLQTSCLSFQLAMKHLHSSATVETCTYLSGSENSYT